MCNPQIEDEELPEMPKNYHKGYSYILKYEYSQIGINNYYENVLFVSYTTLVLSLQLYEKNGFWCGGYYSGNFLEVVRIYVVWILIIINSRT